MAEERTETMLLGLSLPRTDERGPAGEACCSAPAAAEASPMPPVQYLAKGENCLCVVRARRGAVLVDGAAYFSELEAALRRARRSVVIIGWDFDGGVRLRPQSEQAWPIGALLRRLVEARPELEVRILIWSSAVVHGPSGPAQLLFGAEWQDHPRIKLRLDTTHPFYASHHQKIVCIDGELAFVGGMDVTVDRWDTPEHTVDDRRRLLPGGKPYGPVHDVMLMLDADAAAAICGLAHDRWRAATGEMLPSPSARGSVWPQHKITDFEDVAVGLARSIPNWSGRRINEAPRLIADVLQAARRSLYIEAQYLTADHVGDILERRLMEPDGPEVVAVVSAVAHSWLERLVMGGNRNRLIRRLKRADRHDRLRIYHPVAPGSNGGCPILVHSKLVIADDVLLRIGSSNLNNRSVGLDTEFEVVIEACEAKDRTSIAGVRDRLLGEHLGASPERVRQVVAETGSLIATIDRLNIGTRRLRTFRAMRKAGATVPIFGSALFDPVEPFSFGRLWSSLWPRRKLP